MEKDHILLFTYGTLMSGFWNHGYLDADRKTNEDIVMLGEATTVDSFTMFVSGTIPVVQEKPNTEIKGELYMVPPDILEGPIDALEGHPELYIRKYTKVRCKTGTYLAYIYLYPHEIEGAIPVPDGDYRKFMNEVTMQYNEKNIVT